jgi:hypothetical protein
MAVRMVVVMAMMIMSVVVRVPMPMAMRMSVVRMTTHCYHAEQIDGQSQSTDQKKLIGVHLWWIQPKKRYVNAPRTVPLCSQALYGFEYDKN